MNKFISGKVLKVLSDTQILINKGAIDGVSKENVFVIYYEGEEIFDPDTQKSLGILEIVCGEGKPEHIQENMTTLISSKYEQKSSKRIIRKNNLPYYFLSGATEEIYEPTETSPVPFKNINEKCLFKQIK